MPREMNFGGPDCFVARQEQSLTLHFGERLLIRAGFRERLLGDDNSVVIVDRPQPDVKLPMRVLTQRQAVVERCSDCSPFDILGDQNFCVLR